MHQHGCHPASWLALLSTECSVATLFLFPLSLFTFFVQDDSAQVPGMMQYAQHMSGIVKAALVQPLPDAMLTVGSPFLSKQLLEGLATAGKSYKLRVPPRIHYLTTGLWDIRSGKAEARAWKGLAEHLLCSSPVDQKLLESLGSDALFVGHPSVQQALQQQQQLQQRERQAAAAAAAAAAGKSGNAALRTVWLETDDGGATSGAASAAAEVRLPFITGDASMFQRQHGLLPSRASSPTAGRQDINHRQQHPLIGLLPGPHERDIEQLLPLFDVALQQLQVRRLHTWQTITHATEINFSYYQAIWNSAASKIIPFSQQVQYGWRSRGR